MEERPMPLTMVTPGEEVTLIRINGGRGVRSKLLSMGLIPGARIRVLSKNGAGPLLIVIKDTRLALGWGMACKILVKQ